MTHEFIPERKRERNPKYVSQLQRDDVVQSLKESSVTKMTANTHAKSKIQDQCIYVCMHMITIQRLCRSFDFSLRFFVFTLYTVCTRDRLQCIRQRKRKMSANNNNTNNIPTKTLISSSLSASTGTRTSLLIYTYPFV